MKRLEWIIFNQKERNGKLSQKFVTHCRHDEMLDGFFILFLLTNLLPFFSSLSHSFHTYVHPQAVFYHMKNINKKKMYQIYLTAKWMNERNFL